MKLSFDQRRGSPPDPRSEAGFASGLDALAQAGPPFDRVAKFLRAVVEGVPIAAVPNDLPAEIAGILQTQMAKAPNF